MTYDIRTIPDPRGAGMTELEAVIACVAEHAPTWEQPRPIGDRVLGRSPSGGGRKAYRKGRYLSILPLNEDGLPLAVAILEALGLLVPGRMRSWKVSTRDVRALVLWEHSGTISPVRMTSVRSADKVMSLAVIVRDFGARTATGRSGVGECRGLGWT